jgi:hypothetical protein
MTQPGAGRGSCAREELQRAIVKNDVRGLGQYGSRALTQAWKAQHSSYWVTNTLNRLPDATDRGRAEAEGPNRFIRILMSACAEHY